MEEPSNGSQAASYLLIGYGWRAPFFIKPAQLFSDRFRVTGVVTRSKERSQRVHEESGLPTWTSLTKAVKADRPDFVVVAVPWDLSPIFTREVVALGLPVLCETPPAPDLPGLFELWKDVGSSGLVQVAEQYPLYPSHMARKAVIGDGAIGEVNEVEVSSTHMYHAMALVRDYLGIQFEDARVTGLSSTHLLADPRIVPQWTDDMTPKPANTIKAFIEFESGRVGTYDFTDNQWWNPLRMDRLAVRGTMGEIIDFRVTSLVGPRAVVTNHLERRQTGQDLNLEGCDLSNISYGNKVVFENPWLPGRMSDDELAVTELLWQMSRWILKGDAEPYPLAQGCQDWALYLSIARSIAEGTSVNLGEMPWSN